MLKAIWNGTVLAESEEPKLIEGNWYFPAESIHGEYFQQSHTYTTCFWKGVASYYDVIVAGRVNRDADWYNPETKHEAKVIEGYVAFWRGVKIVKEA